MYAPEEHYGNKEIYRYVRGLVSIEAAERMEAHMCDCDACLLKTVQVRHEMIQGCGKASRLLEGYLDETLNSTESVFVETHLILCDRCADEYGAIANGRPGHS
ncbi:MAG: hypothetical protein A4E65_01556 [Syntrophorhabdus sp. PtaU1.Bin153]|nr:MAG: hypothetical protein A4E65_01556 [Syntrophorhabdus sp. PtaU1.Bin153]